MSRRDGRLTRNWLAFLLALALAAFVGGAGAQRVTVRPGLSGHAVVLVQPMVRAQLAAAWDSAVIGSPERIYCLAYTTDTTPQSRAVVYSVILAWPAQMKEAAPAMALGACPKDMRTPGVRVTSLHTHPPFTCYGADGRTDCRAGGVWAWDCSHSDTDSATYRRNRYPVALVQCDRNAFAPYFDPHVTASATTLAPTPSGVLRYGASRYALLVGVVAGGIVDRDRGGYREPWAARATWTGADKQAHAGLGFGIGTLYGARWGCGAGIGFELVQSIGGKGSVPDALVTCASAGVGALARRWVR